MKKKYIIISIIGVLLLISLGLFLYFKMTFLSKDEIKNIIIKDTNLTSSDIYFDSIDLDIEDNRYEVDFYYNNQEYEYKIDAKNGRIIYNNFQINNSVQNNPSNNSNQNNTNNSEITLDEAKNIALNNAKANQSNVTFTETKIDYDDGQKVYDIEFIYNNQKFSYEITANTGEIISYDRDNLR